MKLFANIKVGVKIIAGYLAVLTLMGIVGTVALVRTGDAGTIVDELTNDLAVDRQLGNDIATDIVLARFYAAKYTDTRDITYLNRYTETIKTAAAAINATFADTGQPLVGHVDLVTSDGLNANDAGHAALAAAVTGALKLAGLSVS